MLQLFIKNLMVFTFLVQAVCPCAMAGDIVSLLPVPGTMTGPSEAFVPASLKGVRLLEAGNGLRLEFVLMQGQEKAESAVSKENVDRLIAYFLSALTLPSKDMWVNLSPYEGNRIIPDKFGVTEMGRDLLAQDYLLKQLAASLLYPEKDLGKKFWDEVYRQVQDKFGATDIPVDTFNKVWIVPQKATVYENGMTGYILKSHLKVMLETDYLAMESNVALPTERASPSPSETSETAELTKSIMRAVIIPAIEKEVNEGRQFATLRQIYDAQILAVWFKRALKTSLLGRAYANQSKVAGIDPNSPAVNDAIYQRYVEAFRLGAFNLVKEQEDPVTQELLPRKYFSGGAVPVEEVESTDKLPDGGIPSDGPHTVGVTLGPTREKGITSDKGYSKADKYLVNSRGEGLGSMFERASMKEVMISLPVPDKDGGYQMQAVSFVDYFLKVFNWDREVMSKLLDKKALDFVVGLRSLDNQRLFRQFRKQCSVKGLGTIEFLKNIKSLQALADQVSLSDGRPRESGEVVKQLQLLVDQIIKDLSPKQAHLAILTLHCIMKRWYASDAMPIAYSKDERRKNAILGISMLAHGVGSVLSMDVNTLYSGFPSFFLLAVELALEELKESNVEISDEYARKLKEWDLLSRDLIKVTDTEWRDLLTQLIFFEQRRFPTDEVVRKDFEEQGLDLDVLLNKLIAKNYVIQVERAGANNTKEFLPCVNPLFNGFDPDFTSWLKKYAGAKDAVVVERLGVFRPDWLELESKRLKEAEVGFLARMNQVTGQVLRDLAVSEDDPNSLMRLLNNIPQLQRLGYGSLKFRAFDFQNSLAKVRELIHDIDKDVPVPSVEAGVAWLNTNEAIFTVFDKLSPYQMNVVKVNISNKAREFVEARQWTELSGLPEAQEVRRLLLEVRYSLAPTKITEMQRLHDVYIPAIVANILGEGEIRQIIAEAVAAGEDPLDLQQLFHEKLRIKGNGPKYLNLEIEATEPVKVWTNKQLLLMAMERLVENGATALDGISQYMRNSPELLAGDKKKLWLDQDIAKGLAEQDLKITVVLRNTGNGHVQIVITNPGWIEPREVGSNGNRVKVDPMQIDPLTGMERIYTVDPFRDKFAEGGTSMRFVLGALWNLGAKIRVENVIGDDGRHYVQHTVDFAEQDSVTAPVAGPTAATANLGGIDLNEKYLELDVQRRGGAPDAAQLPAELKNIEGLVPVKVQVSALNDLTGYLTAK